MTTLNVWYSRLLINLPVKLDFDIQFDLLYHMNSNFYISLNDCDEFFYSYFVMTAESMSYFWNVATSQNSVN